MHGQFSAIIALKEQQLDILCIEPLRDLQTKRFINGRSEYNQMYAFVFFVNFPKPLKDNLAGLLKVIGSSY